MSHAWLMLGALLFEALIGWPKVLYRFVAHPVVWIGALIQWLDTHFNRPKLRAQTRRLLGVSSCIVVAGTTMYLAWLITRTMPDNVWGNLGLIIITSSLVATRSLYEHVHAVARALETQNINAAKQAVAKIVGRDPQTLDSPAIARASIESLAENASDGIVAPVFWGLIFGLPGIAGYKAINTLDSMVGHRGARYGEFGWASARLDDIVNWIPARLSALLFIAVTGSRKATKSVMRDAKLHRSPNAGWPESAMARALGVRVSGPRRYAGKKTNEPWVNAKYPDPNAQDIHRGLRIFVRAAALLGLLIGMTAVLTTGIDGLGF